MGIAQRNILCFCALAALFLPAFSFAQSSRHLEASSFREVKISLSARDSVAHLPHQLIVANSEILLLDSLLLAAGKDYVLDNRFGVVRLSPDLVVKLRQHTVSHTLVARYQVLPFTLKERYQHRELIVRRDTTLGQETKVSRPTSSFSVDDLFGANLQKSGSLVRGFTIGSNQDLSLTSGFRIQMAGKITSDVDVVAALTDENTPIQPEGNTQTLQEIDKVFVEIRATDVSATLGDFNVDFTGNEFGGYHRKLQGAKGAANYRTGFSNGSVIVSGAVTRGKFTTNPFQGNEGVQGPYRLSGKNNERDIIIIAGTERVYVDGELMIRGETNDYTIDYASGEITFTSRRLITGVSRIVVDFEYTDRQYPRTLLGAKGNAKVFNDKLNLNVTFIREADDQESPIDLSLSEGDKEILRNAGDDRLKASRSGVDSVGAGKGQYVAVDTIINGLLTRIYRFAPNDPNAAYNVFFSFVSNGRGVYAKVSTGNFQYVGTGQGSYLPVRFLPMPQVQSLIGADFSAEVTDFLGVSGEYALSSVDANRFSSIDDADNKGPAVKFGIRLNPKSIKIGGTDIGSLDIRLHERFIDRRFSPIDRTNEIEFNRKWNLEEINEIDEEIREGTLRYQPIEPLSIGGGIGSIKRGEQFTSQRTEFGISYAAEQLPSAQYNLEVINSRDLILDNKTRWTRQRGTVEYALGKFTPGFRYEGEDRRSNSIITDTAKYGSFRFNEFAPRLAINDLWNMSLSSEFTWRIGDSVLGGTLQRESEIFTQQYGWRLREWNSFSSSVDVTVRKKRFTEAFRHRGNGDVEAILLRFQSRYAHLSRGLESDLFYEASTERASKPERVFVRVPRGSGNYRYLGDINSNGVIDDADFQLDRFAGDFVITKVPSDMLFPIVDLKASVRLRVTPSRFPHLNGWLQDLFAALSTETYLRVEEKSRETDTRKIYFLNFSRFLNDSTTITGSNFISQDLNILENNQQFSLRLRYIQRRGFTQFALANERTYSRERSLRVRWQFIKEISNQTDYMNKSIRVFSDQQTNRSRDIAGNTILSDWSYRPEQSIELGFTFGVGRATDSDSLPALTADLNNQSIRLVYSFQERGQGRVEFHREEVQLDGNRLFLPFELTDGRLPGKTWLWRLGLDYRITQFLQATMSYDGRSEGARNPVHTARAEVRAFF